MGPAGVVVDSPSFNDPPDHVQAPEAVLVQAFVAEAAIEALDEGILDRFARSDGMPLDAALFLPAFRWSRRN